MQGRTGNSKKASRLTIIGACGLLMMMTHQNCGVPGGKGIVTQLNADDASIVTTIDDVNATTALQFATKATEVHSQTTSVVLEGSCSVNQQDSVLAWKVRESAKMGAKAADFARGYASCKDGVFEVELAPTQELECDTEYTVTAQLGAGEKGITTLSRRCAASKAEDVSNVASLKALVSAAKPASSCVLERRDASSCEVVCYSADGIVEGSSPVESQSCSI